MQDPLYGSIFVSMVLHVECFPMSVTADASVDVPLCVDLDGTLVLVDTFQEACVLLLKQHFFHIFLIPFWILRGKSYLKERVNSYIEHDVTTLPVHAGFLQFLQEQKANGRRLILVTAAPFSVAHEVATHLQYFDDVIASTERENVKGRRKAEVLLDRFGYRGFDYAGNSHADLAVWKVARRAILVQPSLGVCRRLGADIIVDRVFQKTSSSPMSFLRSLRLHQLVKNLLIFIPILSSHTIFEPSSVQKGMLAFASFSACTSAVYLFNDLFDIGADRRHSKKRHRPLASGSLTIPLALCGAIALMTVGIGLAWQLSLLFVYAILCYLILTTLYTSVIKKIPMTDVVVLSLLYTSRILAGNIATGISFSFWLLTFSIFFFLSLACLKRYTELLWFLDEGASSIPGRGYNVQDVSLLQMIGIASGMSSILILGLYIDSQRATLLYHHPSMLWISPVLTLYWLMRMWFLAHRRQMDVDPILFAVKDAMSYFIGILIVFLTVLAI